MRATMMNVPLTITHLLDRAARYAPQKEIVSRRPDRSIHRTTWADVHARAGRLAHALARLGVAPGDRVATLAWNHARHLELYLAVPSMGAVLHTLNLRLHPTEIAYIARHAGDKVVVVDETLLPLLTKFIDHVPSVEQVIVMRDTSAPLADKYLDYEALLAPESKDYPWPALDENAAAMICYTSGTTGNPKGVVYSHRSTVLHTLVACMTDTLGVSESDVVMPVVPMFHANAWGLPFCAAATGAKVVFPGPHLDPTSIVDLMAGERVTLAAGVPTIWLGILALLDQDPSRYDLSTVRSMVIGGAAAPPAMIQGFRARHRLEVTHAWGMTETNPLGTVARIKSHMEGASEEDRLRVRSTQGYAAVFVETRHVDDGGRLLPWDGATMGELEVRGPWVASSYIGGEGPEKFTADGWFKTGDVVTIDADGYVRITDRAKDVVKSGGEWISSVALENALMSHPAVLEAAVFAAKHPKWDERPIAAVVLKPDRTATREELVAHLAPLFPKFWLPDDVVFIAQIPRTSTGKFLKSKLREEYGDRLVAG
ncbi:MAG: long-chain fatty acid--CoA ligase [Polyangiales bacterium]